MGLAASQARLLSITARMSDNELRSQLINNAKMRLTADTSRVSDEYIDALNKTQLMFTNFDNQGNEIYQDLTFSSLTAYSAYNDQYGIVNSAGQLIVSTTDANNFEQSASLEQFLEKYGLEKTTDYFETLKTSLEFNEVDPETNIQKGIGYYDPYGKWQPMNISAEEMQAIYEAETFNGITHYGKTDSLNSIEYGDYQQLVLEYRNARSEYKSTVETRMKAWLSGKEVEAGGVDLTPPATTGVLPDSGRFAVSNQGTGTEAQYWRFTDFESYYGWAMRYSENNSANNLPSHDVNWYKDRLLDFAELVGLTRSFTINEGAKPENRMLKDHFPTTDANGNVLKLNEPWLIILRANLGVLDGTIGDTYHDYSYNANGAGAYIVTYPDGHQDLLRGDNHITTIGATAQNPNQELLDVDGYPQNNNRAYIPAAGGETVYFYEFDDKNTYTPAYERTLEDGTVEYSIEGGEGWRISTGHPVVTDDQTEITEQSQAEALKFLYTAFRDGLLGNMTDQTMIMKDTEVRKALDAYLKAAENLAKFIWGDANGEAIVSQMNPDPLNFGQYAKLDMIDYLDNEAWVLSTNAYEDRNNGAAHIGNGYFDVTWDKTEDGVTDDLLIDSLNKCLVNPFATQYPTTTATPGGYATMDVNYGNRTQTYSENYQVVKDLFLIDCMLEHYGEPVYTWIDQANKGEDGTAKAAWYTNLWERMQEGYQKIGAGLGNNQEWLQFAFESGLVHMEQVNRNKEWVPTLYSNCAKITESTVDVDVTLAEAKYKREMAKIEAKDKQYDIELKNIDTEHESLKQEYESIKGVIDKNIERNMKLFVQS
ncbi:MAG: hypothetical protein VZR09_08825 [Candidatus Gastranaerophilaceae bacterium]|nr:hypothetical protein [Candidatus Gastranaerophilaceae bacterium]